MRKTFVTVLGASCLLLVQLGCDSNDSDSQGLSIDMARIPSTTFTIGDSLNQSHVLPMREVTLTRSYFIGLTEVTNSEYVELLQWAYDAGLVTVEEQYVRANGVDLLLMDEVNCEIVFIDGRFDIVSQTWNDLEEGPGFAYPDGYNPAYHPVKMVTWYGAASFCDWLSSVNGLNPFYGEAMSTGINSSPYDAEGYRLPTEAEWELAAKYDSDSSPEHSRVYPWGDADPVAGQLNCRFMESSVGWTTEVGHYPQSSSFLGLKDMGGNVDEWTHDRMFMYGGESSIDPYVPANQEFVSGNYVVRGGSWKFSYNYTECCHRSNAAPGSAFNNYGFRVCKTDS